VNTKDVACRAQLVEGVIRNVMVQHVLYCLVSSNYVGKSTGIFNQSLDKELAWIVWIVSLLRRAVTCKRDQGALGGEGAIPASKYVKPLQSPMVNPCERKIV